MNDVTGGDAGFSGKVGSLNNPAAPERLESREEYLQFIRINKVYIEGIAETTDYRVNHPRYVFRALAKFAMSEIK